MTERPEFSVYQFFPDDSYERVRSFVCGAMRLTRSLGEGITFPTPEERHGRT